MIALVLALSLVGDPGTTTATISVGELAALQAQAVDSGRARAELAVCHDNEAHLERVHRADLADIRTLTATAAAQRSPALEACALGGLVLGAAGGACAGVTDDTARTACTVVGVTTAVAGAACSVIKLLSSP